MNANQISFQLELDAHRRPTLKQWLEVQWWNLITAIRLARLSPYAKAQLLLSITSRTEALYSLPDQFPGEGMEEEIALPIATLEAIMEGPLDPGN